MVAIPVLVACLAGCRAPARSEGRVRAPAASRAATGARPEPRKAATSPPRAPGRVTVDAAGKDLRALADALGKEAGVNIIVDPGIEEEVTLWLVDVDWREAVAAIARETGTRSIEEGENVVRLVRPPSIRMELHDADVRTALLAIAALAGVSIVIPGDIEGKVSLSLKDVAWIDALEAVASSSGHVLVRGTSTGE